MKKIKKLIEEICDAYKIAPNTRSMALDNDARALSQIGCIVGNRAGSKKICIADIHEVTGWGVNWTNSRYPQLHKYARGNRL